MIYLCSLHRLTIRESKREHYPAFWQGKQRRLWELGAVSYQTHPPLPPVFFVVYDLRQSLWYSGRLWGHDHWEEPHNEAKQAAFRCFLCRWYQSNHSREHCTQRKLINLLHGKTNLWSAWSHKKRSNSFCDGCCSSFYLTSALKAKGVYVPGTGHDYEPHTKVYGSLLLDSHKHGMTTHVKQCHIVGSTDTHRSLTNIQIHGKSCS